MNNGKVRIYELSKELSLDNKDILVICDQLNISVKSHSSTITESQAQRIRAVAELHVASRKGNGSTASGGGSTSAPVKGKKSKAGRKPEILAIRPSQKIKTSNASVAQSTESETSTPKVSRPRLLTKPQSPVLKPPETVNSDDVTEPIQVEEQPTKEPVEPEIKEESVLEVEKPQLLGPPSRPTPPAPKVTPVVRPVTKVESKTVVEPKEAAKPSPTPAKPVSPPLRLEKPEVQAPSLPHPVKKPVEEAVKVTPKLQRPSRPNTRPTTELTSVDEEANDDKELESTASVDPEDILEELDKPKPKLKRPTPPRLPKKKVWEEEDEDESNAKSKSGKVAKTKRVKALVIEDDDDEFGSTDGSNSAASAINVSLSIARPPKPASLSAADTSTRASAGAKRAKKPAPSKQENRGSRSDNRERRRDKKVVDERPETITLAGSLTVRELADLLHTQETELVKQLFLKGIAVNVTQSLDIPTAKLVAEELGTQVETQEETAAAAKVTEMIEEGDLESLQKRPPVVTIMGHVDHGKTTLLDSIRKTKVAAGEAGGITQHIGAYHVDVEHNDQTEQIVFLDTPGHEAFTAMRARGTRVTDIAILVVAADDGVQPQTREAISHAKAAKVPIVIAINKIDKAGAEPDRVKQELTEQGLVPEEWGGETIMVPVSAIQGENLDTLLEMILLVAEIEELSANPNRLAKGTIVEANLDKARGPVATLLVQNGTLRVGDSIVAGSVFGKIRAMIDDRGEKVEAATPSFAVEVLGLSDVPAAGDEFDVFASEKEARAIAGQRADERRKSRLEQTMASRRVTLSSLSAQAQEGELKELNLILKADVQGSVEAILGSLKQLPQNEVQIRVLLAAAGEVTETDVDLAAASGAVIIGFNTTLASGSRAAADQEGVDIREYNIIYNLLDEIQGAMEGLLEPEEVEEPLGQVEVRAVFPVGRGAVAGCYVLSGKAIRNCRIRVRRQGQVIYEGNLDSLKRMRDDVKEVNSGFECGIGVDRFNDWQEKDIIEAYQMVLKRRKLSTK